MQNCKICDTVSDDVVCGDECQKQIDKARKRIEKQNKQFREITQGCKQCGKPRDVQKQYCETCIKERRKIQKNKYRIENREKRYCRNETCGKLIEKMNSSSQKYCSDDCRPKPLYSKKEKDISQRKIDTDRRYKGTVALQWIMPRGSKQRKEMGLEYTDYGLCKDSDVGGAFIY